MRARTKAIIKLIVSILLGFGSTIVAFFLLIILLLNYGSTILISLAGAAYLAILAFLVLWNIKKTKRAARFLLLVPAVCAAAAFIVIRYKAAVDSIPTVDETAAYSYGRGPFAEDSPLAELNAKSSFTIKDNAPLLDGATALYPVYGAFARAVYSGSGEADRGYADREDLVFVSKTPGAYENLLNGRVDLIFCAAPSDAQAERFRERNIRLKMVPIGKEAFVFFVNKKNPVDNVTIDDVRGIYSGEITNWKTLGGPGQRIRAFQRPPDSGSQTMLQKIMDGRRVQKAPRENVPQGMGDIVNRVAVYRNFSNAVGYSFLFFVTEMARADTVKLLSIDGVHPSVETIQNNSYPFSDYFYAIYRDEDEKNPNIEAFVEWMVSEQGRELIAKTGYVPLRDD